MCYYCTWGLPPEVEDIYERAVAKLSGNSDPLHYGPSHIVWEDFNLDSAQWCINNFGKFSDGMSEHEKTVVLASLIELRNLDPEVYAMDPEYDESDANLNPRDFPPSWARDRGR